MTISDIDYEILDQAVEDYTGLWELVWAVRTYSSLDSEEDIISVVAPAVDRLLREGFVELYVSAWPARDFTLLEVESERWEEQITWKPADADGRCYWLLATEAGRITHKDHARREALPEEPPQGN